MYILGISAYYHDSAAALLYNGEIISAAQEERFTRIKHDSSFPINSIKYCLEEASINGNQIEYFVFYEKPFLKFERIIETYLAFVPKGLKNFAISMPLWVKDKLFQKKNIIKELTLCLGEIKNLKQKLLFSEHHLSHAASAFYPSPYKKAAVLTIDGVGEWATTSVAIGNENKLEILKEIKFPHSLGLLYSAFTYYTGFKVNSGEYKLMGLAPYGKPKYANLIRNKLIRTSDDGSFQLDMRYFSFATTLKMTNEKFNILFGGPPRKKETKITQKEMDLAASIQEVIEEIIIKICKNISKETGERNLCLAGGVALNCVANGKIHNNKIFDNIWIQPASGDAGGSLGAALSIWYMHLNNKRKISSENDSMKGSYLGPSFNEKQIQYQLDKLKAVYKIYSENEMIEYVVNSLKENKAIGWFQGRMEFGPRALGNRSIIANPTSSFMQKQLNLKVKYRESFRPFAPSIIREDVDQWFDFNDDSPYMLLVKELNKEKRIFVEEKEKYFGLDLLNLKRSVVPAITHVDYSARIQTVHKETNQIFHKLIKKFKDKTGYPLIVNTSFNIRGEPIVCNPKDAYKCFMNTDLDLLIIENFILQKEEQLLNKDIKYKTKYELD